MLLLKSKHTKRIIPGLLCNVIVPRVYICQCTVPIQGLIKVNTNTSKSKSTFIQVLVKQIAVIFLLNNMLEMVNIARRHQPPLCRYVMMLPLSVCKI